MTCSNFVSLALSQKGLEHHGQDRYPVFDVGLQSKIAVVMQKLLCTRVHRIWVVNEANKLTGVVSMTDIIRYFCGKPMARD